MNKFSRNGLCFWRQGLEEVVVNKELCAHNPDPEARTQSDPISPPVSRSQTQHCSRGLSQWTLSLALILVGLYFLLFFRYPVVINSPGPTFDVLGKTRDGVPLIEIKGAKTYPEGNGQLRMTTVSSLGRPGSMVNGLDIITSILNPNSEIIPEESIYPRQLTSKQIKTIGLQQMAQSQLAAESVALSSLGYQVNITCTAAEIPKESPAYGSLKSGDTLVSIAAPNHPAMPIKTIEELHKFLRELPPGTQLKLEVTRKGNPVSLQFPSMAAATGKGSRLGVLLNSSIDVPLDIKFHIKDVGGPSAGTMFALGIVEQLTEQRITSRHNVAGTGTINLAGKVGPISGIPQKMAGAKQDGAEFFLAPSENCADTVGHVPQGLKVTPITTFNDALRALELIRQDRGKDLPTCPQSK
ncbi:YlbL family protein [Mobiluncus mulieris]|uniref:YlbL family protein n=1 Tax=Mobiluncus mulieris TaxID=2052 RepID=UPI0024308D22|nr:S16 family serine protease [Mobiluncus mulieris]